MKPTALILAGAALLTFLDASAAPRDRCLQGPFHRITRTNPNGEIIGPVDRQDWGCLDPVSGAVSPSLGVADIPAPGPPTAVCLMEAAPNPATSQTRLLMAMPATTQATLVIYGIPTGPGRPEPVAVRHLADREFASGLYEFLWDLRDDAGAALAPGIYRVVLTTDAGSLCGDIEIE